MTNKKEAKEILMKGFNVTEKEDENIIDLALGIQSTKIKELEKEAYLKCKTCNGTGNINGRGSQILGEICCPDCKGNGKISYKKENTKLKQQLKELNKSITKDIKDMEKVSD